jgi:hypothetical protein
MKTIKPLTLAIILGLGYAFGANSPRIVADPITDFTARHKNDVRGESEKNEGVIRLEVDIDNDGSKDVLLSSEMSGVDAESENRVHNWDVYRKLEDGRYASIELHQFNMPDGPELLQGTVQFDPDIFYVGFIKEVNAFGILATFYLPKHNGVELLAYVLRGDHFEVLHFPDPKKTPEVYHRDDANNIPDLPETARSYLVKPSIKKVIVSPSSGAAKGETDSDMLSRTTDSALLAVQPTAPKKTPEVKPTTSTQSEESPSSTPLSIIVVLIVAATGLLWLLLKKRK